MKSYLARILISVSIPLLLLLLLWAPHHIPRYLSPVQADTLLTASSGAWIKGDHCLVFFATHIVVDRLASMTPAKRYDAQITSDHMLFLATEEMQAYQLSMEYDTYIDRDIPILRIDGIGPLSAGTYRYGETAHCRRVVFQSL
jgi:hypothetical protein